MQTADPSNFFRTETELALEDARRKKSDRTKGLGEPIEVPGKPLAICVKDGFVWCAESTAVVRKIDLETGKIVRVYKGHTAPVTCLGLYSDPQKPDSAPLVIAGSWDKTVKIWDAHTGELLSSTSGHHDFVKALLVIPELKVLVTSGADKRVKVWSFENPWSKNPLRTLAISESQQRPVTCLAASVQSDTAATLVTADSMGRIKTYDLQRYGEGGFFIKETGLLTGHRTGINDMSLGEGLLWTASTDETAMVQPFPPPDPNSIAPHKLPPITHPKPVKALLALQHTHLEDPILVTACGEVIHTYDVSASEPKLLSKTDAHWHDITGLRLWMRRVTDEKGRMVAEPWVVSASLDGTVRKWKLAELLKPVPSAPPEDEKPKQESNIPTLTEEEERELAELMDSD